MGLFNIAIDYSRSYGSHVWDTRLQRPYLDMLNHYSSLPLGYDPLPQEFYNEILSVAHLKTALGEYGGSNEYLDFLYEFKEFAIPEGFTKYHFANTGSLAVEAAIKTAWYNFDYERTMIISMRNSFHGVNSLSNFITTSPRVGGRPFNNFAHILEEDKLQHVIGGYAEQKSLSCVIVEPVQCTNGDHYVPLKVLKGIREATKAHKIPLIFDEVQTGFGTTGRVWYWQHIGIEPDIIVFGKKSQVSGILVNEEFDGIFEKPEKLSVTYDGDLVDCIRSKYVIREITKRNLMDNINIMGSLLIRELVDLPEIQEVRGIGGLVAFDFDSSEKRNEFYAKCFDNGLIVNPTGERSIRLRPHLAVTEEDINECVEKIKKSI